MGVTGLGGMLVGWGKGDLIERGSTSLRNLEKEVGRSVS